MKSRAAPYLFFATWNLLSYASLASALVAIGCLAGIVPRHGAAAIALLASFVCDLFDGKFAKSFPRSEDEKRFGEQIDSLVDVVAFGFVPASLVYFLFPDPAPWLVATALFYALSVLTRLAFYNVFSASTDFFTGLPCPMGQYVWAAILLWPPSPPVLAALYVGLAIAMVSPLRIPRPGLGGLAGLTLGAIALGVVAYLR